MLRVIDLCRTVEQRKLDPFEVEVREILESLRARLSEWKLPEEFYLDAEAIREIVEIIKLQGDWIKHRSSLLYVDSLLLTLKIRRMDSKSLAYSLLKSMYPIVSIDQITPERLVEAIEYWNQLIPLGERMRREFPPVAPAGSLNVMDLLRLGFVSEKAFIEHLEELWRELIRRKKDGRVLYWDFIYRDNYEDTISRAYLTSFLVTYGYSRLETDPITGEVFLIPYEQPKVSFIGEQTFSFPISLEYEVWKKWKERHSKN